MKLVFRLKIVLYKVKNNSRIYNVISNIFIRLQDSFNNNKPLENIAFEGFILRKFYFSKL